MSFHDQKYTVNVEFVLHVHCIHRNYICLLKPRSQKITDCSCYIPPSPKDPQSPEHIGTQKTKLIISHLRGLGKDIRISWKWLGGKAPERDIFYQWFMIFMGSLILYWIKKFLAGLHPKLLNFLEAFESPSLIPFPNWLNDFLDLHIYLFKVTVAPVWLWLKLYG
jgi:hypothetical protein